MGDQANSLCAVYAMLAENQLRSGDPDMEVVFEQLDNIKQYCQTVSYPPGETPPHLEEHQFEEGSTAEGVVVVDGERMPASAAERMNE